MRCLYCGKEVALFKRLRGGEFCSDAHRQKYQEEYTELALHRLALANASKNGEKEPEPKAAADAKLKDGRTPELESPALKRREGADRDEPAVMRPFATAESPVATAGLEEHELSEYKSAEQEEVVESYDETPVSEPLSAPAPLVEAAVEEPVVEEPPSPPVHGFIMETVIPPSDVDRSALPQVAANLVNPPAILIPRLPDLQALSADLDHGGAVDLPRFAATDAPVQPIERELEVRMFVRGAPQVEVPVQSAVESGFDPVDRALDVEFDSAPPGESPQLWSAPGADFPAPDGQLVLLGDLARLDFELTAWGEETAEGEAEAPSLAATEATPEPPQVEPTHAEPPLGPARMDSAPLTISPAPAPKPASIPVPVRFDPVHINPVLMEKIAGTPQVESVSPEPEVEEHAPEISAEVPEASEENSPVETAQAETAPAEPPSEPETPVPGAVTKPMPVTLHGVAPTRGKPHQVFTSAVTREGALQVPREAALPLRPLMVLGPAVKPAADRPATEKPSPEKQPEKSAGKSEAESASPKTSLKSVPVPERREARPDAPSRKSDVRVMPMPVKEQTPKSEPASRPEPVRQSPIPKTEPVKEAPAAPLKEVAALKETAPAEPKPAKAPVEIRAAAPAREASAPAAKKSVETPAEEDLLGLPKLSIEKESAWSRLSNTTKLIVIAAVLALMIGGIILTSRGSGASKAAGPAASGPVLVEEPALANDAGWTQDWFADRGGSGLNRHVDVLRGSLALGDFRLLFEGQIEQGALGWVFRANNKSFYVEKIQVVTPGLNPVVALVRFAVINGREQPRTQTPLDIQAHLDTMYKIRMDVVRDHFTTWVQDNKVDEWTDGQLEAGGVGLYYENGDSAKLRDTLHVIPLQQK